MRLFYRELKAGKPGAFGRFLRREKGALAFVFLALAIAFAVWKVEQIANESHRAICAQRANSEEQIRQTVNYLAEHPGPEPLPGVTRETFQQGLDRQRAFVKAISFVDCS